MQESSLKQWDYLKKCIHMRENFRDEPVASQDPYRAEQITDILVQLNRQYNITVIMNSHSVELALKKSDRIIGIADGRLVLDKKSSEVTDENIEFIYGGAYEKYE